MGADLWDSLGTSEGRDLSAGFPNTPRSVCCSFGLATVLLERKPGALQVLFCVLKIVQNPFYFLLPSFFPFFFFFPPFPCFFLSCFSCLFFCVGGGLRNPACAFALLNSLSWIFSFHTRWFFIFWFSLLILSSGSRLIFELTFSIQGQKEYFRSDSSIFFWFCVCVYLCVCVAQSATWFFSFHHVDSWDLVSLGCKCLFLWAFLMAQSSIFFQKFWL